MSRKTLVLLTFMIPAWVLAQQVVTNPEKPPHPQAGRILRLEKELSITDEQDGFYFKRPRNLQVAPDGSMFLQDEDQLLMFDASGEFQKNLFKKGQGPGEVEQIIDYLISSDQITVLQAQPNKIVLLDRQGEFLREIKPDQSFYRLFAIHGGRYYGAHNSRPQFEKLGDEPTIVDITWNIRIASDQGSVETTELNFPVKWFMQRIESAVIANYIVDIVARPIGDRHLVIFHTQDYLLKLLDLDSGKVIREFSREYDPVKMKPDKTGQVETRPGTFTLVPPVDRFNDILNFFILGDQIWVVTSALSADKGFLVDVFDSAGRYLDNFYLPLQNSIKQAGLSRHPLCITDAHLYVVEYGEDDIPVLVKYRMID